MAAVSTASPANASSQLPNRQVRGQDHRALLVALGHDLEEEVCLLSPNGTYPISSMISSFGIATVRSMISFMVPAAARPRANRMA
jgi:hypothetical protein